MALVGFTPSTQVIDPRTGVLTSEGFRLFQFIVQAVSGAGNVVTEDGEQTLTNKTIDGDQNTLLDIATASLKTRTGVIGRVVTGEAGVGGNFSQWNGDGDLVDSGKAVPGGAVVGTSDAQTLTAKTISADDNTISGLDVDDFDPSAIVTAADTISGNDNDTTLPTSAAVKDYVDGATVLDPTLQALAALNATPGLLTQTAADTFTKRTLTGTTSQITVTNGNGVSDNPTLSLAVGNIVTGTWTPTLTSVANVDSSTALLCHYIRIGSQVMCWGALQVDATAAAATQTQVGISLPIASNFASAVDCVGNAVSHNPVNTASIIADTANDRAQLTYLSTSTSNIGLYFVFGYEII